MTTSREFQAAGIVRVEYDAAEGRSGATFADQGGSELTLWIPRDIRDRAMAALVGTTTHVFREFRRTELEGRERREPGTGEEVTGFDMWIPAVETPGVEIEFDHRQTSTLVFLQREDVQPLIERLQRLLSVFEED